MLNYIYIYIYIYPKLLEEVDMKKKGVHNVKLEKILKKLTWRKYIKKRA